MNIENIQLLAEALSGLGFASDLRNQLLFYACLRQKEFSIRDQKVFGADIVSYQIFFRSKEGELTCTHYDASLRRVIRIASSGESGAILESLENKMKAVNWKRLSQFDSAAAVSFDNKKTWEEQAVAEAVISELDVLSATVAGRETADILKYKYWVDLPLENYIPNLLVLKNRLELSQRFYIAGSDGITTDEAFRFLNNRWIQRQMQTEKRNSLNKREISRSSDTPSGNKNAKKENKKKTRASK